MQGFVLSAIVGRIIARNEHGVMIEEWRMDETEVGIQDTGAAVTNEAALQGM